MVRFSHLTFRGECPWGVDKQLMCGENTEFGKEKQELLAGKHTAISTKVCIANQIDATGLTDKEIEEKITTLVKQTL